MEKFGWTPQQIADIPDTKIREIFMTMNQRKVAIEEKQKADEVNK